MEDSARFDEMLNEFKRFLHFLTPADKDIFLQKLIKEVNEAKKIADEEEITHLENANTDINTIEGEIEGIKNQVETQDIIDSVQGEIQESLQQDPINSHNLDSTHTIQTESNPTTQISNEELHNNITNDLVDSNKSDNTKEQVKQTSQPNPSHSQSQDSNAIETASNESLVDDSHTKELSFDEKIQQSLDLFIQEHKQELLDMGLIKEVQEDNCTIEVYSNTPFLTQDNIKEFQKQYDNAPNKKEWHPNISIDTIKTNIQESNSYEKTIVDDIKNISNTNMKSLADVKNLNPNTYFTDLIDWFEKKKIENLNMPISKEQFKKEFLEYCKNGMGENEMKILLILQNKEPTKLTGEHKEMIAQGLKLNMTNNKLIDKGLETAIKASVKENVTNNDFVQFQKSVTKIKSSQNLIDKKLSDGIIEKIAIKVKEQAPKLTLDNKKKLDDIINNKSQTQTKTKGRTL